MAEKNEPEAKYSLWNLPPNWHDAPIYRMPPLTEEQIKTLIEKMKDFKIDPNDPDLAPFRNVRLSDRAMNTVIGGPNSGLYLNQPIC